MRSFSELGTTNLYSIPQPQIPQNCKRCSAIANPQVCDRFAITFRTSANLDCNIYFYFVLVMTFFLFLFFLEVKYCPRQDIDLRKKKVINTRTLTLENKSVYLRAVLPRNRQHCILLWGFAVNFSFFTANPKIETGVRNLWTCRPICGSAHLWSFF